MQLIYRAQVFNVAPREPQPYVKPHALNWRFRAPGEVYGDESSIPPVYVAPRALNWRFQMQAGW